MNEKKHTWLLLNPGRPIQTVLDGLFGYGKEDAE